MEKIDNYPARWGLITFIIIAILVGVIFIPISIGIRPYVKISAGETFIGYYKTYSEFENLYNKIINEVDINEIKFIETEISSEQVIITNHLAEQDNKYELINSQMISEYKIYKLMVNNEVNIYFTDYDSAQAIVDDLKPKVNQTTQFEISEYITRDLSIVDSEEEVAQLVANVQEANKLVVTSRSNSTTRGYVDYANYIRNESFLWPTSGTIVTSNFGYRWSSFHTGVDIGTPQGSPVYASMSGVVVCSSWQGNYGYYIQIQHDSEVVTCYAHNSQLLVNVGDYVEQGDVIAWSGSTGNSTGPHVHFEVKINGNFVNPLNFL